MFYYFYIVLSSTVSWYRKKTSAPAPPPPTPFIRNTPPPGTLYEHLNTCSDQEVMVQFNLHSAGGASASTHKSRRFELQLFFIATDEDSFVFKLAL